jgi:epoxyqueuosine reductase
VPILERAIAVRAGLGFIGKNHMLINPELGSEIFLGEIITTLELEPDSAMDRKCDGCDKCLKACPTGALSCDGLDASKCISYLTIESKEEIPGELAEKMGERLFGCDECVAVCPYQKNAPVCRNEEIRFYPELGRIGPDMLLGMDEAEFKKRFGHTSLIRAGLEKLKVTAGLCLRNQRG